jgi:hypothetical protein
VAVVVAAWVVRAAGAVTATAALEKVALEETEAMAAGLAEQVAQAGWAAGSAASAETGAKAAAATGAVAEVAVGADGGEAAVTAVAGLHLPEAAKGMEEISSSLCNMCTLLASLPCSKSRSRRFAAPEGYTALLGT